MSGFGPEIQRDFLVETGELLERLDADLARMEGPRRDPELIDRAFRALHTIKGNASFLALTDIVAVAHAAEEALDAVRSGNAAMESGLVNFMYASVDALRRRIRGLEAEAGTTATPEGARGQTLERLFAKRGELARELARRTGKEIDVVVRGGAIEVDRAVAEAVGDALTHLLRNAVDHGVEPSDERARAGKARRGTITLSARREGAFAVVRVQDDGRGLDRAQILARAAERGPAARGGAECAADSDVYALIFAPGFTTAAGVSELSGRGVGMDVVKTSIEGVGGAVEVESAPGRGVCVSMRVPLARAD